jgi:hypothetical protein
MQRAIVLPDERIPIDPDPLSVLNLLFATYQENPPHLLPSPPEARSSRRKQPTGHGIDIARFNEAHELVTLLEYYGAKRVGRGLYLCPFHDDRRASLGVYMRNGQTFCHCLSKHSECPLSLRGRNDAFNVYCTAEELTTEEALRKINGREENW